MDEELLWYFKKGKLSIRNIEIGKLLIRLTGQPKDPNQSMIKTFESCPQFAA